MADVMKQYACLHTHSTHSDGIYSPCKLAEVAYHEGYGAIALTDHDTVTGNRELMEECKKYGLDSIFGIEFSTKSRECHSNFHVTAFHIDPEYPELRDYLDKLSEKETDQTRILFKRGVDIGFIKGITWDEVLEYNAGISWLCNEHVFRAMKSKGLITDIEYPEFFDTCFGIHRHEVPPKHEYMDVKELIPLIHRAGGIAVFAHPSPSVKELTHIEKMLEYGVDGIEVWHGDLNIETRRNTLRAARKYDLYVSGGADHSGLLGGEYSKYEKPEETIYYFPPTTLGTTKYFFEEIRDVKKKPDRLAVMDELIENDELWVSSGGLKRN